MGEFDKIGTTQGIIEIEKQVRARLAELKEWEQSLRVEVPRLYAAMNSLESALSIYSRAYGNTPEYTMYMIALARDVLPSLEQDVREYEAYTQARNDLAETMPNIKNLAHRLAAYRPPGDGVSAGQRYPADLTMRKIDGSPVPIPIEKLNLPDIQPTKQADKSTSAEAAGGV